MSDESINFSRDNGAVSISTLHERLGHVNKRDLQRMLSSTATGIDVIKGTKLASFCEAWILAKMTRGPIQTSNTVATRPGELVFSDLDGPFPVAGIGGKFRYFVTYIDKYTRYVKLFLLDHKSDQLNAFKQFTASLMSRNDVGHPIARLESFQSDYGGEYMPGSFQQLLKETGVHHRTIAASNPSSNGTAERLNRSIMELADSIRHQAKLGPEWWTHSVSTAVYLLNRRPHAALREHISLFEAWFKVKPDLGHVRVFGCDSWFLIPGWQRSKLAARARRAIFIGYCFNQKAYRLWDVEKNKLFVSRDVTFNEFFFYL
jgi:transposase InsO family protein